MSLSRSLFVFQLTVFWVFDCQKKHLKKTVVKWHGRLY